MSLFFGVSSIFIEKAQAQREGLEVSYPTISNFPPPHGVKTYLPHYIKYIYHFFIISGGIIVLLVVILGGFRFLSSAGNPSVLSDAKNQIFSGFIGLIILFGSYIILNEINPDIVKLQPPAPQALRTGIILYSTSTSACTSLGSQASIPELTVLPPGTLYKAMVHSGSAVLQKNPEILPLSLYSFESSKKLSLELFSNEECAGDPFHVISGPNGLEVNKCHTLDFGNEVRCIKMDWTRPGVWVFSELDNGNVPNPTKLPDNWIEGKQYTVFDVSQNSLNSPFFDNVKGIALVPDKTLEQNYGVVLHNMTGGLMENKGWASIYLPGESNTDSGKTQCEVKGDITLCGPFDDGRHNDASSITIFTVPQPGTPSPSKAIKVCREVRCLPRRIDNTDYSASMILHPNNTSELYDITSFFGSGGSAGNNLFFKGTETVFGRSFKGDKWKYDTDEEPIRIGNESGISAIEIEEGAPYLVLLYTSFFGEHDKEDGLHELNTRKSVPTAIINHSVESLADVGVPDKVGAIVVIKLGNSAGKR